MGLGILRVAAYSAVVNRPLHTPASDPQASDSSIQHFYDKLLHIRDRLKTSQGRQLGAQRHQLVSRMYQLGLGFLTNSHIDDGVLRCSQYGIRCDYSSE